MMKRKFIITFIFLIAFIGNVIDVILETGVQEVEEVVVTALGIRREKKALGYSVCHHEGAGKIIVDIMNNLNDPRMPIWFVPTTTDGVFRGSERGCWGAGGSDDYKM